MKAAIINEAMKKNVANTTKWPSRRSQQQRLRLVPDAPRRCRRPASPTRSPRRPPTRKPCCRALILEADYGLGRNPMNMVQMTGLGSRCVEQMFTTGRNDGVPGVHPGHTPYMNADAWGGGYMADPQYYAKQGLSGLEGVAARRGALERALLLLEQRVHAPAEHARQDVPAGLPVLAGRNAVWREEQLSPVRGRNAAPR